MKIKTELTQHCQYVCPQQTQGPVRLVKSVIIKSEKKHNTFLG